MEKEELIQRKAKRPLEEASSSERREKRQKMPRKDKAEKKEERKKIEKRLRDEAMKEIRPIVIGSLAMVASTISNQGERCQDDYCLWYLIFLTRFAPPPCISCPPFTWKTLGPKVID